MSIKTLTLHISFFKDEDAFYDIVLKRKMKQLFTSFPVFVTAIDVRKKHSKSM